MVDYTRACLLQASHTHVKKQLERTAGQLADSISSVSGLEAQLSAAKAKYTYMQEKRGYIADLCDMLQVGALWELAGPPSPPGSDRY